MLWKPYALYRMMRVVNGKFAYNVSSTLNADRDTSFIKLTLWLMPILFMFFSSSLETNKKCVHSEGLKGKK